MRKDFRNQRSPDTDLEMMGPVTLDQFRRVLRLLYPREEGWTNALLGEHLGVSAGFIGLVLQGKREPSKKMLDALDMERVVRFRYTRAKRR